MEASFEKKNFSVVSKLYSTEDALERTIDVAFTCEIQHHQDKNTPDTIIIHATEDVFSKLGNHTNDAFKNKLNEQKGLTRTITISKQEDVAAVCGFLLIVANVIIVWKEVKEAEVKVLDEEGNETPTKKPVKVFYQLVSAIACKFGDVEERKSFDANNFISCYRQKKVEPHSGTITSSMLGKGVFIFAGLLMCVSMLAVIGAICGVILAGAFASASATGVIMLAVGVGVVAVLAALVVTYLLAAYFFKGADCLNLFFHGKRAKLDNTNELNFGKNKKGLKGDNDENGEFSHQELPASSFSKSPLIVPGSSPRTVPGSSPRTVPGSSSHTVPGGNKPSVLGGGVFGDENANETPKVVQTL